MVFYPGITVLDIYGLAIISGILEAQKLAGHQ